MELTPVDDFETWTVEELRAYVLEGAAEIEAEDMAAAYLDLFVSRDAAKMALTRENPEQMPIEKYLIGVCSGFSAIGHRRQGARGPTGKLLYDATRIEPVAWLTECIGAVVVVP